MVVVSGCGGHDTETSVRRPQSASPSVTPSYDAALPPVQAVLALVPHAATTLTLTDFDQVRAQLGGVTRGFWRQAARQAPLLTTGILRGAGTGPLTQDDIAWEAHYSGGGTDGWIAAFHVGVDLSQVTHQLHGATVDGRVVTSQTLSASDPRWTGLSGLSDLVGPEAEATYVERGCLPGDTGTNAGGQRLQPLTAYAVSFGAHLATAYLGRGRTDLFTRLRLGDAIPSFTADYTGGVADPSSGRIGFTMTDAADAAQQALRHKLPFAVCAEADVR